MSTNNNTLIAIAQNKALFGCENQPVEKGNSMLMRGRVVCGEDVRYQMWIQHLIGLGVDVGAYSVNANILSYAYSPEIPDYGLRGELVQVMAPSSKTNSENTNITVASPTNEGEMANDKR